MARFKDYSRDQGFLLPQDMREWVPDDDLAHFVIEACERVDLSKFETTSRNSGVEQYHPQMMLALLVYSYAIGIFSSRRIERASCRDIGVRFVAANQYPDHNTIAIFRRRNGEAIKAAFLHIVQLAQKIGMLKLGSVSIDGTKIKANASRVKSIRYDRAKELSAQLETEIAALLDKAEQADKDELDDPKLPQELARREVLKRKLDAAITAMEAEARAKADAQRPEYEAKVARQQAQKAKGERRAPKINPPREEPEPGKQHNLTDPDCGLMRKSSRDGFMAAYNAQAIVDADGSLLILGTDVAQTPADQPGFQQCINRLCDEVGRPGTVLADAGYDNHQAVEAMKAQGIKPLVAIRGGGKQRPHDFRPPPKNAGKAPRPITEPWRLEMIDIMNEPDNQAEYAKRKITVEPVFGIIKNVIGFTEFLLRGIEGVKIEWDLVSTAYNAKRLHQLMAKG